MAVSIVLSFTMLRLLDALPGSFSREKRYWPHTVWVTTLLYISATFWWLNWSNRILESLSFRYFLFLLFAPGVLYLTATALVSASPASVPSWREHFFRNRMRFFLGAFTYIAALAINSYVTFEVPLFDRLRLAQTTLMLLFGLGAILKTERAQAVLAGICAVATGWSLTQALLSGEMPLSFE
ncbi:MAG: hypothetical protein CMJ84_03850 [Planctomycetes bacterium]|nr:hypothetical protein [Planctomycetota bacterium]